MRLIVGCVVHRGSVAEQKLYNIKSRVGERDRSHCTVGSLGHNTAEEQVLHM